MAVDLLRASFPRSRPNAIELTAKEDRQFLDAIPTITGAFVPFSRNIQSSFEAHKLREQHFFGSPGASEIVPSELTPRRANDHASFVLQGRFLSAAFLVSSAGSFLQQNMWHGGILGNLPTEIRAEIT